MRSLFIIVITFLAVGVGAQQAKTTVAAKPKNMAVPAKTYNTMRDSCTQLDIVYLTGKGGSMSLEGKNVRYFTQFVDTKTSDTKPNAQQDAQIMWQIRGREYLSGKIFFSSDSSGYVTFSQTNKEYVNALTPQGAGFLKSRGGK